MGGESTSGIVPVRIQVLLHMIVMFELSQIFWPRDASVLQRSPVGPTRLSTDYSRFPASHDMLTICSALCE